MIAVLRKRLEAYVNRFSPMSSIPCEIFIETKKFTCTIIVILALSSIHVQL